MKNKIIALAAAALFAAITITSLTARAGVFTLAGTGATVNASSSTNFTLLTQIGTFTVGQENANITQAACTNNNNVIYRQMLTFDGTNFFAMPQTYTNLTTNAISGVLIVVTNITFPVYAALNVSNANLSAVSNVLVTGQN